MRIRQQPFLNFSSVLKKSLGAFCFLVTLLFSQEASRQEIQQKLQHVEQNQLLEADIRTKLSKLYQKSLERWDRIIEWEVKASQWSKKLQAFPSTLEKMKNELESRSGEHIELPLDLSWKQTETLFLNTQRVFKEHQYTLKQWHEDLWKQTLWRENLEHLQNSVKRRLDEVANQLAQLPSESLAPELAQANLLFLALSKRDLIQEAESYEKECLFYEANKKESELQDKYLVLQCVLSE
ncbi:MAG: hypothetical protein AABZ60_06650, partial [Planctomycetota bacterium]